MFDPSITFSVREALIRNTFHHTRSSVLRVIDSRTLILKTDYCF